jgi:hypothetical protein
MTKPKPQTVLKDFSALEVSKRIELTALNLFELVHRGVKDLSYKPK